MLQNLKKGEDKFGMETAFQLQHSSYIHTL